MKRYELKEQIGIDMVELYNFSVISIDEKRLRNSIKTNKKKKDCCVKIFNLKDNSEGDKGAFIFNSGESCDGIKIDDNNMFNTLHFTTIETDRGHRVQYDRLKICIGKDDILGNIQNVTVTELKDNLKAVIQYIKQVYGIELNTNSIKINYLEVNCTFGLDDSFTTYVRTFNLLMSNLNKSYRTYDEKYKITYTSKENILLKRRNESCEIRIYDKANSISRQGRVNVLSNVARIEFVMHQGKIKSEFRSKLLKDITDDKLIEVL